MHEYIYLLSGNIDPSRDTDKIHYDILKVSGKEKPHILLFATASNGADWHNNYLKNISNIFSKYHCSYKIIDDVESPDISNELKSADIIYFLGGSPYKHSRLTKYREEFKKIPVKVGTSAGAIYLAYPVFYVGKDDYILAVPDMLGFVNLHILPHSETHKEEIVCNYLENEVFISFAKFYNQVGLKIENIDGNEIVTALMGETPGSFEKIEIILNNRKIINIDKDSIINIPFKIVIP